MGNLSLNKDSLKRFGIIMGIALLVISLIIFLRQRHNPLPFLWLSIVFFLLAFLYPGFLRFIYIPWMKLAFVLSWINTRIILVIVFYLLLTPIGLIIRLLKFDLLDRKIEKEKESYWKKKEHRPFVPLEYERQF